MKRTEKKSFHSWGCVAHLWLSGGQTLSSSSSSSVEDKSGQLFSGVAPVVQRGTGALAEMLFCRAKAGMPLSFGRKTTSERSSAREGSTMGTTEQR